MNKKVVILCKCWIDKNQQNIGFTRIKPIVYWKHEKCNVGYILLSKFVRLQSTKNAMWATFYHLNSSDDNPQYDRCPPGRKVGVSGTM